MISDPLICNKKVMIFFYPNGVNGLNRKNVININPVT